MLLVAYALIMKKVFFLFICFTLFCTIHLFAQKQANLPKSNASIQVNDCDQKYKDSERSLVSELVKTYPNPFDEYVTISFSLQNKAHVQLVVFDKNGQLVAQIRDSTAPKGNYELQWNGTNNLGAPVKNGNYKIQLIAGELKNTSNVMLKR